MPDIDETHDRDALSWVEGSGDHDQFPVQNLPLGVFAPEGEAPRVGTAIGDWILDLDAIEAMGLLSDRADRIFGKPALNALFALPNAERRALRRRIFRLLTDHARRAAIEPHLHHGNGCSMRLPAAVGDYTDFYVGIHHARNVGKLFRPDNPLLPNYKHMPIAYHGRASSIRPSGTPVVRPAGQRQPAGAEGPQFGPTRKLDYELELGFWICGENALGTPVPIGTARDRVAGLCLLNDWSARDIQAWEYVPLGPFLAKNFMTSISPWIVTAEALAPFALALPDRPEGDPAPLPYLEDPQDRKSGGYAIRLEARLSTRKMREAGMAAIPIAGSTASEMYWSAAQMIAHHSVNGCNMRPGDLLGSGTISGPDRQSAGSLLEATRNGQDPIALPNGDMRAFLEDGDQVILTGTACADGYRSIGFGSCEGIVCPAAQQD